MRFDAGKRFPFKNMTAGFIGAVTYTPAGDEKAIAVEPGAIVHLSEAEQELTARAPRDAANNPFIEQELRVVDPETGEAESKMVTPLIPFDESRPVGVRSDAEETATTPRKRKTTSAS